jgi:hypothetical protein
MKALFLTHHTTEFMAGGASATEDSKKPNNDH